MHTATVSCPSGAAQTSIVIPPDVTSVGVVLTGAGVGSAADGMINLDFDEQGRLSILRLVATQICL
jgi:hypothetical protein